MIRPIKEFFFSFVLSFYSRDFYRALIDAPLSKGISYLCSLALLMTVIGAIFLNVQVKPRLNDFMVWAESAIPPFTLSAAEGMKLQSGASRLEAIYPGYGPIVLFDSQKADAELAELKKFPVVFTAKKIYLWNGLNDDHRVIELSSFEEFKREPNRQFAVDGKSIHQFLIANKILLLLWACAFILIGFLIWKFLAALFYSWFGLVYNYFRFPRLPYSTILNLSIFVLTPVICIQMLQLLVPALSKIPFGFFGAFIVTTSYLAFAIKGTEDFIEPEEKAG